ncbi:YciI family protein [Notoacmeibacter ruber]|uniref:YciI family protein n=1 Tax=Notoacmeibacter ruber TaxID=2670375 RepID=A0A3L7JEV7_9HYPH|nr:YciI family protein [Notoacmeibacter ruber]RLQ89010.1 YciI family protein [Notoacmeibacter ruber]
MHYALICIDKSNSVSLRMATREDHLAWLKGQQAEGKVLFTGPFLSDEGEMNGSLLLVDVPDRQAAEAMAAADPYAKAGLFASTDIRAWKWVIGKPEDKD